MDLLVREHLAQLPDKYRMPLVYSAIDGLDHETIGGMLGVHAGSVRTLVFRAATVKFDDQLDEALRRLPAWTPPPHFAERMSRRVSIRDESQAMVPRVRFWIGAIPRAWLSLVSTRRSLT